MRVTSRSTASTTDSRAARGSPSRRTSSASMKASTRGGLAREVGADQVVLALEEPVDRHLAQAGLADQLVHADAARAAAGEEPLGGVQDDRLPLGAAAANRCRGVVRWRRGTGRRSRQGSCTTAVTEQFAARRGWLLCVTRGARVARGAGERWGRCGDSVTLGDRRPEAARLAVSSRRTRRGLASMRATVAVACSGARDSSVCASVESSDTRMSRCSVVHVRSVPPRGPSRKRPGPVILAAAR